MTDLDKLIKAVEGGGFPGDLDELNRSKVFKDWSQGYTAGMAFNGSLDAAISLYDALLGHDAGWTVSQHIAKVVMGEFGAAGAYESVIPRNPARALLLSTLKAYRSLR